MNQLPASINAKTYSFQEIQEKVKKLSRSGAILKIYNPIINKCKRYSTLDKFNECQANWKLENKMFEWENSFSTRIVVYSIVPKD
jgi:hypothetical protein